MGDSSDLGVISSQDDRSTLDRDFVPSSPSSSDVTDDQQSVRRAKRGRIMGDVAGEMMRGAAATDEEEEVVGVEEGNGDDRGGGSIR